jgi:hypothetical protein
VRQSQQDAAGHLTRALTAGGAPTVCARVQSHEMGGHEMGGWPVMSAGRASLAGETVIGELENL